MGFFDDIDIADFFADVPDVVANSDERLTVGALRQAISDADDDWEVTISFLDFPGEDRYPLEAMAVDFLKNAHTGDRHVELTVVSPSVYEPEQD